MPLLRRAIAATSRRLERPELLAAFYSVPRQTLREEIAITAILAAALRRGSTYVDIGANRGQVLEQAVRLAPEGDHIAFEPIPRVAADLAKAFPKVECRQMALGARPETAEFCHFRSLEGWSGLKRSPEVSDERGDPEYITVTVSTLDTEIGSRLPRVVKIDVEGAELGVLEGARELLSRAGPLVIFEHVAAAAALYGTRSEALWDLLESLGYEVLAVTGEGPLTRQQFAANTTVVNWLARPLAAS
ncbi:MAG TPA: FkbM family methyltransferase [Solirubrobacteraceae bacterium]|jgi:FkbM family methyltransferase|nr:FkbM family methyltransferase [Solirubrobacteraceae bacterium]